MTASSRSLNSSIIQLLDQEIATFGDDRSPLLSYQIDAFKSYVNILQEDDTSLADRSKQRRHERLRTRDLLTDIFVGVGTEAFVLCTLAVPVTTCSKATPRTFVPLLRNWWKSVSRPRALTLAATELCKTYAIGTLVSSSRKRKFSEIRPVSGQDLPPPSNVDVRPHNADTEAGNTPPTQEGRSTRVSTTKYAAGEDCSQESAIALDNQAAKGAALNPDSNNPGTAGSGNGPNGRLSPTRARNDSHNQPAQAHEPVVPEASSPSANVNSKTEKSNKSKTRAEQEKELHTQEPNTLSGRVFELSLHDARTIIESGQVESQVWLTEPYGQSKPFITITLSTEMCDYISAQRQQVM